jgi:hypothetical protein
MTIIVAFKMLLSPLVATVKTPTLLQCLHLTLNTSTSSFFLSADDSLSNRPSDRKDAAAAAARIDYLRRQPDLLRVRRVLGERRRRGVLPLRSGARPEARVRLVPRRREVHKEEPVPGNKTVTIWTYTFDTDKPHVRHPANAHFDSPLKVGF